MSIEYRGAIPDFDKKYGMLSAIRPIGYKQYGKSKKYFFLWKCDCGNEKEYPVREVLSGKCKSCRCLSYRHNPRGWTKSRNPQMSSWKMLFKRYRSSAKHRDISFSIDINSFIEICSQNCWYCGSEPKKFNKWNEPNIRKKGRLFTDSEREEYTILANGIDRINSTIGYWEPNIRPCCKNCNRAKMDLTEENFLNLIQKIYERHIK